MKTNSACVYYWYSDPPDIQQNLLQKEFTSRLLKTKYKTKSYSIVCLKRTTNAYIHFGFYLIADLIRRPV